MAAIMRSDRAVSERLTEFLVEMHWQDVPAEVRPEAK
jgi:hypothetical protein